MAIGLFFAGQSLVVWSFFSANVMGLAAGMVIAIAAVGVGYLHLSPVRPGPNRPAQDQQISKPTSETPEPHPGRTAPSHRRLRRGPNGIASLD
jgi:hypothetical protein